MDENSDEDDENLKVAPSASVLAPKDKSLQPTLGFFMVWLVGNCDTWKDGPRPPQHHHRISGFPNAYPSIFMMLSYIMLNMNFVAMILRASLLCFLNICYAWRQQTTISYILKEKPPRKPPKNYVKIIKLPSQENSKKSILLSTIPHQIDLLFDEQVPQQQLKHLCGYYMSTLPKEKKTLNHGSQVYHPLSVNEKSPSFMIFDA